MLLIFYCICIYNMYICIEYIYNIYIICNNVVYIYIYYIHNIHMYWNGILHMVGQIKYIIKVNFTCFFFLSKIWLLEDSHICLMSSFHGIHRPHVIWALLPLWPHLLLVFLSLTHTTAVTLISLPEQAEPPSALGQYGLYSLICLQRCFSVSCDTALVPSERLTWSL